MDNNAVLVALIAAAATIIVGLFSLFPVKRETNIQTQKEIYEAALNLVWEPLDKLFSLQKELAPAEILVVIDSIVSNNYKLIPTEFIRELAHIKAQETVHDSDFAKLTVIIASYFNWIRKYLGYPFNGRKIKIEYSPRSIFNIILLSIGHTIFFFWSIASIGMLFFLVVMQWSNPQHSLSVYSLLGIICLTILPIAHFYFNQTKK